MTPMSGISLNEAERRHSQPGSLFAASIHSKSGFDVDAPRTPMVRRLPPDDATLASNDNDNEGLTEEQRAWAGIESVLDDNETIDTREVLPEEVIQAMSYSYSSMQSASLRMGSPRRQRKALSKLQDSQQQPLEEKEEDDVSLDSHDRALRKMCGGHQNDDNDIPALLNSSFSSLQSEQTAKSILSFVSAKNLIVQDNFEDGPLKDFLGNMTKALERKKQVGPVVQGEDDNNIFNIFSWSQKENVDQKKKKDFLMPENRVLSAEHSLHQQATSFNQDLLMMSPQQQQQAAEHLQGSFSQDLLMSPQAAFFPNGGGGFNPNDELNNSLPSLTSIRESDIANSQHVMAQKWASFGDLEFDPAQQQQQHQPIVDEPETTPKKRKKKKLKKKKPTAEHSTKKKKKKKKTDAAKSPEQTFDSYFPAFPETQDNILASPAGRSAPPTPRASNRSKSYLSSPTKSTRSLRFRDHKNPLSALRSRIPKISLFGKGRQQPSPTGVIDTGAREAQFFPGIDEEEGDWGGLLSY